MSFYEKNCDFLSWGKLYLHIWGCVWHKWGAYLQCIISLHHNAFCTAFMDVAVLWPRPYRYSIVRCPRRGTMQLHTLLGMEAVDMSYALHLHSWWLIYWSIGHFFWDVDIRFYIFMVEVCLFISYEVGCLKCYTSPLKLLSNEPVV